MTDPEEERLTVPSAPMLSQFQNCVVSVPPFAPTPHYALNTPECDGNASYRAASTSTGRSGTLATSTTHAHNQLASKNDCNIHEVCHYFQQVVFVLAILTGIALVIAGSVMQSQTGELVVFVYIGALLISVNSALLSIQCYVRRKQKRRQRTYTASRSTVLAPPIQHTNNLQYTSVGPQSLSQGETRHYFVNQGPGGTGLQPFLENQLVAGSPTESQTAKYYSSMHSMVSLRPGSVGSHGHHYHHHHHHHHQNKDKYHQSPPMGQQIRSHGMHIPGASVPLLPTPRSDLGPVLDTPPPSYTELARSGRIPQEGTTVHLL